MVYDPTAPPVDDDEPETWPCYRHPDRQTALRCGSCERPMCVDCAVTAAVGMKCRECARQPAAARGRVPRTRLLRGVAAGAVAAGVTGYLYGQLDLPFVGLIVAWLLGMGIGEVVRRASGGFRDQELARAAATCAAVGFAWQPTLWLVAGVPAEAAIWPLLGALLAAWSAYSRAG